MPSYQYLLVLATQLPDSFEPVFAIKLMSLPFDIGIAMDQSLRQRGWSINSYGDDHSRRDRAESMATHQSEMTEQSMSEAEKLSLLKV